VTVFIFAVIVVSIGGTIAIVMGNRTTPTTREIRRLPHGSVTRLGAGERVRLVGIARGSGAHVTTPDAQHACLAYGSKLYLGDDDNQVYMMVPFTLETDAGTIAIAEAPAGQCIVESDHLALRKPGVKSFGASMIAREAASEGVSASVYEEVIDAEMRVAIVGTVEIVEGTMYLTGTAARPLLISAKARAVQ
jgi:hypothetical protein